jgi:phasin family protein
MKMTERLMEASAEARSQAAAFATRAIDTAATRVDAAKKPVDVLAKAGQDLNTLAHRYTSDLIDLQVSVVKGVLADGAARLRDLARSESVAEAYASQVEALPASRDRLVKNAQGLWGIIEGTGREAGSIVFGTYAELVRPAPAKKTVKRAAKRTIRTKKAA